MGSDLYSVKVAEKGTHTVSLMIEVIHPDSNYISDNASFALMLLHEGARRADGAPLNEELSFDDVMDRGWVERYARGFIQGVEVSVLSGEAHASDSEQWLKAKVDITVTDPAWIQHLEIDATFESRAFEVAFSFQDHPPIHPGQVDPNAPVPEAFVAIPGALFDVEGVPQVVQAAAFSASSYRSPDLREGKFKADEISDLNGRVVLYQGKWDSSLEVGFVHIAGSSIYLLTVSNGSYGSSSSSQFEGKIGEAELIPGKRLGARLKVSELVSRMDARLTGAVVEGDSVQFTVSVPPGHSDIGRMTDDQLPGAGFIMLIAPLQPVDRFASFDKLAPGKLAWTIETEVVRLFDPQERQKSKYINGEMVPAGDTMPQAFSLATKLANGFIKNAEIVSKPDGEAPNIDELSFQEQTEFFSKPFPELVLKITVHHEVYLEHLAEPFEPRKLQNFARAEPWEGDIPEPVTEPTGFGETEDATEEAPAPGASASSSGGDDSGEEGPNKLLLYGGIGVGALLVLIFLGFVVCCCLPSAMA